MFHEEQNAVSAVRSRTVMEGVVNRTNLKNREVSKKRIGRQRGS